MTILTRALICGPAACLPEDLAALPADLAGAPVFAVNDAWRAVKPGFLVSYDPEIVHQVEEARARWAPDRFEVHGVTVHQGIDVRWDEPDAIVTNSTSAYLAVWIAKKLGFEELILCGVPLVGGDGYIPGVPPGPNGIGRLDPGGDVIREIQTRWIELEKEGKLEGVGSMSGFTRDLLGGPGDDDVC